jgi:hypothetical protein
MDFSNILATFITPPIPYFFLGLLAAFAKSDLEIPGPIAKFISLYLLMAIGFKGGVELFHSGLSGSVVLTMVLAAVMATIVPLYSFFILKRKLDVKNAAVIAACYGSVSAVTFIAASSLLNELKIEFGGEMVAAMALMESPSIIIGVWLVNKYRDQKVDEHDHGHGWKEIIQEAFFNGSIIVLIGSLFIGYFSHEKGMAVMQPFTGSIFKGMLAFFLIDMGVLAGKRFKGLTEAGYKVALFGIWMPMVNAAFGIAIAYFCGFSEGNAFMFTVLCASASYIAVPAAMRLAVPEANPGIYVPMTLAITFPFNIIVGLPIYLEIISRLF